MIKKILILVAPIGFLLLLLGCSTTHFKGGNATPVYATPVAGHRDQFKIEGTTNFYLWGLYPKGNVVRIDELARDEGLISLSKVMIEEFVSFEDAVMSVLTLGMYCPRTYRISGLAKK